MHAKAGVVVTFGLLCSSKKMQIQSIQSGGQQFRPKQALSP